MATKKAGSTAKKTTRSSQTKTKVTAVSTKASATSRPSLNLRNNALVGAFIGEFIGAFVLVTAFLVTKGEPLYLGFAAIAAVLLVATVSGAHLNPVITVGAWVTRRIGHTKALVYVVAQILGAAAAFSVLSHYLEGMKSPDGAAMMTAAGREVFQIAALSNDNRWYVFFAEILGASLFAFAVAGVWREKADRVAKAFTIGFGLFVAVLVAGVAASYVGANAVINPAAALAASAIDFNNVDWFAVAVYLGAPLVGGVVGFALRDVVESN
jgi:glycerol uptake facilitator-like aquaporin